MSIRSCHQWNDATTPPLLLRLFRIYVVCKEREKKTTRVSITWWPSFGEAAIRRPDMFSHAQTCTNMPHTWGHHWRRQHKRSAEVIIITHNHQHRVTTSFMLKMGGEGRREGVSKKICDEFIRKRYCLQTRYSRKYCLPSNNVDSFIGTDKQTYEHTQGIQ